MINAHPDLAPITSFNVFGSGGQVDFNFGSVFGIKTYASVTAVTDSNLISCGHYS